MNTVELQNNIIRKILNITDEELLDYLDKILSTKGKSTSVYKLNDFEKNIYAGYQYLLIYEKPGSEHSIY